ncbi:RbsD/FucU family protein [Saccharothrix luteola]|uniref:RbsD/FucU family protein n=1 Tax=Saccharothrix luteola TaxID=2893018 RepID=UPI001E38BEAC|nr:RbsD/FucU family protein [Saccharothrix luteola]MCC8246993.1 RbsD/FucU family protein [Saccharothrix luteola]
MLRFPLIHPPLLHALATAGHGSKVLLADANYAHRTNVHHRAEVIHLNLRPGLVTVDEVLEPVLSAIPVEAVHTMRPDDLGTPAAWADYERVLGPDLPLQPLARQDFYAACRAPELAVCVATGDGRHYANVLLTVGAIS